MARRRAQGVDKGPRDWLAYARYALASTGAIGLALLGIYGYYRVDQFLATDERFRLPRPEETPGLEIEGIVHAGSEKVLKVLAEDFGRSIYLLPLKERLQNVLEVDWVKEASIARLWPNRVRVRITERNPVAFVQLPRRRGAFQAALIDIDGVILDPPEWGQFALPVLTGIGPAQDLETRRERVRRALQLVDDLGELAADISEIDVTDPENLKVTQQVGGRAVVLMLGNRRFRPRLENFLSHYPEIRRRVAAASTFDLRLDDRITAVQEGGSGG